jgi:hypothetical protein
MRNSMEIQFNDLRVIEQHNLVTLVDVLLHGDVDIISIRREFDGTASVIYLYENKVKTYNLTKGES